jgi:hypothetical protein
MAFSPLRKPVCVVFTGEAHPINNKKAGSTNTKKTRSLAITNYRVPLNAPETRIIAVHDKYNSGESRRFSSN